MNEIDLELRPKLVTIGSTDVWREFVKRLPRSIPRYRNESPLGTSLNGIYDYFNAGMAQATSEQLEIIARQQQRANAVYHPYSGIFPPITYGFGTTPFGF